jgi:hypothetical protein
MSTQPDIKPDRRKEDLEIQKARIGARATVRAAVLGLLGTVIAGGLGFSAAVLLHQGGGSAEVKEVVPGEIVAPLDGERVGLCPLIRGVAPPVDGGVAYWFAVQGVADERNPDHKIYLARQIAVNPKRSEWDLGNVHIAKPNQLNQDFYLLLLRTDGDLTHRFADHIARNDNDRYFPRLDPRIVVVDRIRVTQTAEPAC